MIFKGLRLITLLLSSLLGKALSKPLVLLISFDGFRWDYLSRTDTPNFDRLIQEGVKAKWIEDVYITQTFPNHYTIATGMYEEAHGIVANQFYDPKLNASFSYVKDSSKKPVFWGGEPIWITNQKQNHSSGVYFWVGSEVKIKGTYPTVYKHFNASVSWFERVDAVVDWLSNKPDADGKVLDINLALLYFSQPDHDGHRYGPESDEVTHQIKRCDVIIGYLISKLEKQGLFDMVNIIITSDHGMASLSDDKRKLALDTVLDQSKVAHLINLGVAVQVWPEPGEDEAVFEQLRKLGEHVKVWKKNDIPERFHYTHNVRISPIFVAPEDGWFIVTNHNDSIGMKGSHGFDNSLMDMHPFFIAHGPSFKINYISEPFSNIHIYSLICHILHLKPSPNNGSLSKIQHILKEVPIVNVYDTSEVLNFNLLFLVCGVLFVVGMVVTVLSFTRYTSPHHGSSSSKILQKTTFNKENVQIRLTSPVPYSKLTDISSET